MSYLFSTWIHGIRWMKSAAAAAWAASSKSIYFNESVNNEGLNIPGIVSEWLSGNSAVTVNYWIKKDNNATQEAHFFVSQFLAQNKVSCLQITSDRLQFQVRPAVGDSNRSYFSPSGGFGASYNGTWTMITFKVDVNAESGQIYIDGSPVTTTGGGTFTATTFSAEEGDNSAIGISADEVNFDFQGKLDEFTFWNKALSDAEVTELYNSGVPADPEAHSAAGNLTNYYRMGDGTGDSFPTIKDQVGTTDGTMNSNMVAGDIVTDAP